MTSKALMQSAPGPETVIDGIKYLYFGGTSYLGLAAHPEVTEAGCAAFRQFGVHSATSRSGYGTIQPVLDTERLAAEFFGTEAAFYFASGYAANQILVTALAPEVDRIAVADSAHYSVHEAAGGASRPVYRFRAQDPDDLAQSIHSARRVLVMADAVGSATGLVAPVHEYLTVLSRQGGGTLLLDDAHGFGVLGSAGRGWFDELELWPHVNGGPLREGVSLAVCGTLAKALGGFGGIIPGTGEFIERVRRSSHYYEGASAPAAPIAASSAKALEIAKREPWRRVQVREKAIYLRRRLHDLGIVVPEAPTAHFGFCIGDAENMRRIHEQLKTRGILLPYFASYSGVSGEGLLRAAVFADHTRAQLDRLAEELAKLV